MSEEDFLASVASALSAAAGREVTVRVARRLAGGASQEAWRLTAHWDGTAHEVVLRRALGGRMFEDALDRADEFRVIELAYRHGVAVPRPYWLLPDVAGAPAFLMQAVDGETLGRRIVRAPALSGARARLARQMGEQLARIHAIEPAEAGFLPGPDAGEDAAQYALRTLRRTLDGVEEPYPVLELALVWLQERLPRAAAADLVLCHGDFRVGNVVVDAGGLAGVLDWEFAHCGPRGADLAFGAIRAWRFGADTLLYGGIDSLQTFCDSYNALAGTALTPDDLYVWEVFANAKWAIATVTQARRHLDGVQPSMELASLGRMTAEVELELLSLLDPGHPRQRC